MDKVQKFLRECRNSQRQRCEGQRFFYELYRLHLAEMPFHQALAFASLALEEVARRIVAFLPTHGPVMARRLSKLRAMMSDITDMGIDFYRRTDL